MPRADTTRDERPRRVGAFTRFAQAIARLSGRPAIVVAACLIVLAWVAVGPLYRFSDKWLLVINTATTIITFLMVFLIQHTQNRDATAVQLKLSELLLTMKGAESRIAAVEHLSDEELDILREEYRKKSADRVRATDAP